MPYSSRVCSGSSGFTLLEILVALTVSAIAFTALFAIFSRVTDVAGKVDAQVRLTQVGRTILHRLRSDVESLYRPQEEETGTNSTLFSGEQPLLGDVFEAQNVLEFFSFSGLSFTPEFPKRQINRVSYILSPREDSELYQLIRRETTSALVSGEKRQQQSNTFSQNVEAFEVEFFEDQNAMAVSSWNRDTFASEEHMWPESFVVLFTLAYQGKTMDFESLFFVGQRQHGPEKEQ